MLTEKCIHKVLDQNLAVRANTNQPDPQVGPVYLLPTPNLQPEGIPKKFFRKMPIIDQQDHRQTLLVF